MQLSVKKVRHQTSSNPHNRSRRSTSLAELQEGEQAILESLEMEEATARRLMELGFLPGQLIAAARSAPSGDPRVFRVDGSEVALRRETALQLQVRFTE